MSYRRVARSLWLVSVLLAVVVVIVSCAAPTAPAPTAAPAEKSAPAPAEKTVPTAAPAKASAEKMTINFWTWFQGTHYEENLKDLIAKFQKTHPNVDVKYESLTWEEGSQKVAVQLAAGEPPDVMFAYFNPTWIDTGYMMPLDDYMTKEEKDDFGKPSLDAYTYRGKVYGFPIWKQLWNISANKALLEQAGIDWKKIQAEGWDFDQFTEVAKKLTKDQGKFGKKQWGFIYNGTWSNSGMPEMWFLWNQNSGLPYAVDEKGKFLYNDPRALDNLNRIISYGKDLKISPPDNAAYETQKMTDMFNAWEGAMIARSGPYIVPQQKTRCDNIKAGKEQGECIEPVMLPFPHLKGEKEGTNAGVPGHVVYKGKTDKGAAFYQTAIEFARHLSSAEGNCRWSADLYEVPASDSAIKYCQENKILDMSDPNLVFFKNYFDRAAIMALTLDPDLGKKATKMQQEAIFPNYQAALLGSKPADQAFKDIVNTAETILK